MTAAVPTAPPRTYQQRMKALERANEIRSARAESKRGAKRGTVDLLEVLAAPPTEFDSMKVFDLLLAVPKYGRVKVGKILAQVQVSPSKTVGGLSPRQRRELIERMARQRTAPKDLGGDT